MNIPFVALPEQPDVRVPGALAVFADQLADTSITDMFVNGATGLFVDRGQGAVRVPDWQLSEPEVRTLATALIAQGGRHVDDAHPCVDVRLDDGIRVHVVLAPVAAHGTSISIRVPRAMAVSLDELQVRGGMSQGELLFLRDAIERRANFLISGGAGAGKTTLLSAMLTAAPMHERILTIEDVAELQLAHPHHVALEARQANLEGAGGVGLDRLVREALRMKPDRLVVGECRGAEVRELLSALNTGHSGGAGTVHANSLQDVAARLEALGALVGMAPEPLARQVVSAMEFVVHVERTAAGQRRIAAIGRFVLRGEHLGIEPVELREPVVSPASCTTHVGVEPLQLRPRPHPAAWFRAEGAAAPDRPSLPTHPVADEFPAAQRIQAWERAMAPLTSWQEDVASAEDDRLVLPPPFTFVPAVLSGPEGSHASAA